MEIISRLVKSVNFKNESFEKYDRSPLQYKHKYTQYRNLLNTQNERRLQQKIENDKHFSKSL